MNYGILPSVDRRREASVEKERTYPTLEIILFSWLTTKQVADMHDMAVSNVRYLCEKHWKPAKDAIRLGREWYIRPETAQAYHKSERTGRYPDR